MKFRELKVGDTFRFRSEHSPEEIRKKVAYRKYVDFQTRTIYGLGPGDPNYVKKARGESPVVKV